MQKFKGNVLQCLNAIRDYILEISVNALEVLTTLFSF